MRIKTFLSKNATDGCFDEKIKLPYFFIFQVPKSRHTMNDIHVLELTVEYLKQTTDFRRGINLCAMETETFLYDHHFDSKSMNKLVKEITHRISNIPEPECAEVNTFQAATTAANDGWPNTTRKQIADSFLPENWQRDRSLATAVLLDLSMKQNRKKDCVIDNSETHSAAGMCGNSRKREILEKIRKKILDKRRLSGVARVKFDDDKDLMWRPWRV